MSRYAHHVRLPLRFSPRRWLLAAVLERLDTMASEQQAHADDVAAQLTAAADQLTAGFDGLSVDVADLKAQIAAIPAAESVDFIAVDASLARVKAVADALTALDATTPAPVEEPPVDPTV